MYIIFAKICQTRFLLSFRQMRRFSIWSGLLDNTNVLLFPVFYNFRRCPGGYITNYVLFYKLLCDRRPFPRLLLPNIDPLLCARMCMRVCLRPALLYSSALNCPPSPSCWTSTSILQPILPDQGNLFDQGLSLTILCPSSRWSASKFV